MFIYTVEVRTHYGDMGDCYIASYQRTEEGAYLALDELAKQEGLLEHAHDLSTGGYYYSNKARELVVEKILLKD